MPPKPSAEFVYHREDVLAVDHRPHDPQQPVACRDETFQQLMGEVRAPLAAKPGEIERDDSVDERQGVASLLLAFEPLAGWRQVAVTDTRKRGDWAHFIAGLLDGQYRDAERVVLVMDQLNTHSPASLYEAFAPEKAKRFADRREIHHTPKHGAWLNMAASEFSVLARDLPHRVGDRTAMDKHVTAWQQRRNTDQAKANWQFTTADARIKLHKLYPTVQGLTNY